MQLFTSETQSRVFLAACCKTAPTAWLHAIAQVDAALKRHRLRPFFDNPIVHMSLCWWPAEAAKAAHDAMTELQKLFDAHLGTLQVKVC